MRLSASVLLVCAAMAASPSLGSRTIDLGAMLKRSGLGAALAGDGRRQSVPDMVGRVAMHIKEMLGPIAGRHPGRRLADPGPPPDLPGSFYGFIPKFEGAVALPGLTATGSIGAAPRPAPVPAVNVTDSRCFPSVTARGSAAGTDPKTGAAVFNVTLTSSAPGQAGCDELYLLATTSSLQVVDLDASGRGTASFVVADVPAGATEWVAREGVRVFRFYKGLLETLGQVADTAALFIPSITDGPGLDAESMALNRGLLRQYLNMTTTDRARVLTGIDPDDIQSGDLLAIHRADGLGTFEQIGTGEATSHIAMAMRLGEDNVLHVVESTDKTAYWPNPNIQSTRWEEWVELSLACNYTVALLQLKPELRAPGVWNQSAVNEYLAATMGLPYGYHNFLWGFQDVPAGNFPVPLDWHMLEVVFRVIEDVSPETVTSFVLQAMNFRLSGGASYQGIDTLTAVSNAAAKQGMTLGDLYSMPGSDDWVFSDGPSMVCDVYACHIYKAAGLFRHAGIADEDINCVEFNNFDAYSLNFFVDDPAKRPAACQAEDPGFPYCFVMGSYTIDLRGFNSITPYAHMAEHCSAQWPDFARPPRC